MTLGQLRGYFRLFFKALTLAIRDHYPTWQQTEEYEILCQLAGLLENRGPRLLIGADVRSHTLYLALLGDKGRQFTELEQASRDEDLCWTMRLEWMRPNYKKRKETI